MEGYKNLAGAVVLQAVKDWRDAAKKVTKKPDSPEACRMKSKCEEFFLSDWFYELSGLEGVYILRKLKVENEDD